MNVADALVPGETGLLADAIWAPLNAKFVLPSTFSLVIAKLCGTVPTLCRVIVYVCPDVSCKFGPGEVMLLALVPKPYDGESEA